MEKLLVTCNFSFPQCFQRACFPGASKGVIVWEWVNHLPDNNIPAISKLNLIKHSANDNFTFDENGRKFSKWVENTVGKVEIVCYEPSLLFPQCFQKTYAAHVKTRDCLGKGYSD